MFYVKLTNYKIEVTTQAKQIVSISLFHHHLDIRCIYNIHNRVQVTASRVLSFLILIPGHSPGCADMGTAPCNLSAQEGEALVAGHSFERLQQQEKLQCLAVCKEKSHQLFSSFLEELLRSSGFGLRAANWFLMLF